MKLLLTSHFWNEEQLLPYWLKHHLPLFDHAVLVDYGSTDNSRDIIRELAPHWEVRSSRNKFFEAANCDEELMEIERSYDGYWKMVLNTTEFVFLRSIKARLEQLLTDWPTQESFAFSVVIMVEDPIARDDSLTDESLVLQKHHGRILHISPFPSGANIAEQVTDGRRYRCIHRYTDGKYRVGRHGSHVYNWLIVPDTFIPWFILSPWNIAKFRRLQTQLKVPISDLQTGCGWHQLITADEFEDYYQRELSKSYELLDIKDYKAAYDAYRSGT